MDFQASATSSRNGRNSRLSRLARAAAFAAALFTAGSPASSNTPTSPVQLGALARVADPEGVVLAVLTPFVDKGGSAGAVRLSVYDDAATFLENAAAKHEARLNEEGLAVMTLGALTPGDYAFVVYFDRNGDGVLNRGKVLGLPKEPFAFSNGVRPKLRKPTFEETKVDVGPGSVVVIELQDD